MSRRKDPYRSRPEDLGLFYVRNRAGQPVPLSTLASIKMQSGPEFTLRYNLFRSAQINGSAAPGYSSGQANQALEEVFAQTMGPEMGYDYMGMSFQEKAGPERSQARGRVRSFPALCFSHPGRAL
jgi:HAE1 family hydrophobic/amphiphilic exporter-1